MIKLYMNTDAIARESPYFIGIRVLADHREVGLPTQASSEVVPL
jgi:hypothetical protein